MDSNRSSTSTLASSVISSMPSRRLRAAALWPSPKLAVRIRIFLIVTIPAASLPRAYVNQVTRMLNVIHICGPGMARSPFSVEAPIPFGTPLRMKTHSAGAQSSFVPISPMVHIGTNRAVFEIMREMASPPTRSYSIASPEPRRSTSVAHTEVLRRDSGEAPVRPAGRSGAGLEELGARGSAFWGAKLGSDGSLGRVSVDEDTR